MTLKNKLIEGLKDELRHRKAYLSEPIQTIYFGGGTPSVLSGEEVQGILKTIDSLFEVDINVEVTLEANPDDLSLEKLTAFSKAGINRLSIGIQSFDENVLKWMNRSHTAIQALDCCVLAQETGISNLSIDLIYGIPNVTLDHWKSQIEQALKLGVQHISAYCLTSEPKTVLHHQITKGLVQLPPDDHANDQFLFLIEELNKNGFDHYEISNFAKPGWHSKHNTNYWFNASYLGIGPSAHSFNKQVRSWNIKNNHKYIKAIGEGLWEAGNEVLTEEEKYNEFVLTRLRTMWGIDREDLNNQFSSLLVNHFISTSKAFLEQGLLVLNKTTYTLTPKGKTMADYIASELFSIKP